MTLNSPPLETDYRKLRRKLDAFRAWLDERGAQLLEPTNEWEVLRYKTDVCTSIIYTSKRENLRFTGDAGVAWNAFLHGVEYRAGPATKRAKNMPMYSTLRKRDGDKCFFCGVKVEHHHQSIEHLVSLTHGGPDHIANMVLAHVDCNAKASHLPVYEKVLLREMLQKQRTEGPPWDA